MIDLIPQRDFLVGVDSDGCAFDTMELKHKECFIPNMINTYGLQGVSKYAREVAEFVNLYSKSRGINRFPGLVETLERLAQRFTVAAFLPPVEDLQEQLAAKEFTEAFGGIGDARLTAELNRIEGRIQALPVYQAPSTGP